jgi:hypothetical protein
MGISLLNNNTQILFNFPTSQLPYPPNTKYATELIWFPDSVFPKINLNSYRERASHFCMSLRSLHSPSGILRQACVKRSRNEVKRGSRKILTKNHSMRSRSVSAGEAALKGLGLMLRRSSNLRFVNYEMTIYFLSLRNKNWDSPYWDFHHKFCPFTQN